MYVFVYMRTFIYHFSDKSSHLYMMQLRKLTMLQRIWRRGGWRTDHLNGSVLLQIWFQEDIAPAWWEAKREKKYYYPRFTCFTCYAKGAMHDTGFPTRAPIYGYSLSIWYRNCNWIAHRTWSIPCSDIRFRKEPRFSMVSLLRSEKWA